MRHLVISKIYGHKSSRFLLIIFISFFVLSSQAKEVYSAGSNISVKFYNSSDQGDLPYHYTLGDWSAEAKQAIVEAAKVINKTFEIDNRMTFSVIWSADLSNIAEAYVRFEDTSRAYGIWQLDNNYKYPRELLNQLVGGSTFAGENIVIAFNSKKDWCMSTTAQPTNSQQDLMTVALHELSHGLGISSSFTKTNEKTPYIFDKYIVDGSNARILDTRYYPSNSHRHSALTSDDLYYAGPNALKDNNEGIKLHAPANFSAASIVHVDRQYANNENARLLIPGTSYGVSTREFGSFAVSMLEDIGWTTKSSYNSTVGNESIATSDENSIHVTGRQGTITIDNNGYGNMQVAIYNVSGQLVKNDILSGNSSYQVTPNNIYIVKIDDKTYKVRA